MYYEPHGQAIMNYLFVELILLFVLFFNSRTDQDIQTYTIAVINALFLKAPEEKRQVRLQCAHTALSHCTAFTVLYIIFTMQ